MKKSFLDCALFQYCYHRYLLPTIAAVEFLAATNKAIRFESLHSTNAKTVGEIFWRNQRIPMLLPDLSVPSELLKPTKIVITRRILEQNQEGYLAFPFEGTPKRLKLTPNEITWLDQSKKQVLILTNQQQIQASILDVTRIKC